MDFLQPHTLLACDMDGTVAPVGSDPDYPGLLSGFAALLEADPRLALAYVTGRDLDSALELMDKAGLPRPRALVCDVGTTIHHPAADGTWILDVGYAAAMSEAMSGREAADVLEMLRGVPGLEPQPPANQGRWKASFVLRRGAPGDISFEAAEARLRDAGLDLSLVRSSCVFRGRDMLDVLPRGVTKATAVEHLAAGLGLPREATVFAGDSHNDLAPLLAAGRAIVVGNAPRELRDEVLAGRDPDTVCAAAGEHLAGVLEGCRRFGLA